MTRTQHDDIEDHDRGLAFDLSTLIGRRRLLTVVGATGLAAVVAACGSSSGSSQATAATAEPAAPAALQQIPEETAGPYPGDGSNGVNVLSASGIVRSDIRASFGSSAAVAAGVRTTIALKLIDATNGSPLEGAALYIWHCDAKGQYSMYSAGAKQENYLRGVQVAGTDGVVRFASIYPACYDGRWPHIHYEVYPTVGEATSATNKVATSQLALDKSVSEAVYATDDYPSSAANLSRVSLATDMVFSDGAQLETPTITGSVAEGYVISMTAAIRV